jgi:tRNA 2-thiouridine synthesizing protein A
MANYEKLQEERECRPRHVAAGACNTGVSAAPALVTMTKAATSTHHEEAVIMNFDKDLDARGLNCPLPILRAKKALTDMQSGQVLRIVSTDLGSVKDFQAFCKQTGNDLLSSTQAENEYTFFLKRK